MQLKFSKCYSNLFFPSGAKTVDSTKMRKAAHLRMLGIKLVNLGAGQRKLFGRSVMT